MNENGNLEKRQKEAASYLDAGFSYSQIAEIMGVAPSTVYLDLKEKVPPRPLTEEELQRAIKIAGPPRGMFKTKQIKESIETVETAPKFENPRQEAASYRDAGFSYYQIAEIMGIAVKNVWKNLAAETPGRLLTASELKKAIKIAGEPRGMQKKKI